MTTQKETHALRANAGELNSYPTGAAPVTRELLCYKSKNDLVCMENYDRKYQ